MYFFHGNSIARASLKHPPTLLWRVTFTPGKDRSIDRQKYLINCFTRAQCQQSPALRWRGCLTPGK